MGGVGRAEPRFVINARILCTEVQGTNKSPWRPRRHAVKNEAAPRPGAFFLSLRPRLELQLEAALHAGEMPD